MRSSITVSRVYIFYRLSGGDGAVTNVSVYTLESELVSTIDLKVKDIADISLEEGTALVISNGSGSLTEVTPSWAP